VLLLNTPSVASDAGDVDASAVLASHRHVLCGVR